MLPVPVCQINNQNLFQHNSMSTPPTIPHPPDPSIAGDSGASNTLLIQGKFNSFVPDGALSNISCRTANHGIITSKRAGYLSLAGVKVRAYEFHEKDLAMSLLSISDLTDANLQVVFEKDRGLVLDQAGQTIMTGHRSPKDRIYYFQACHPQE